LQRLQPQGPKLLQPPWQAWLVVLQVPQQQAV
jgi:hypothetical protein